MKISIDFWNTICISNPEFKKARELLCREYNINLKIIQNYKKNNLELEKKGIHVYRENLITNTNFINDMNSLFLKYPPLPIYNNIFEDIKKLRQDHQIFICSNTGLIHGDTLSKFLWNTLEIPEHMCKFSDRLGVCKPNNNMFFHTDWHIGDNEITDGGCQQYGIKFYHTKNPLTIKNFIHEHI